jgi:hypothetical protein
MSHKYFSVPEGLRTQVNVFRFVDCFLSSTNSPIFKPRSLVREGTTISRSAGKHVATARVSVIHVERRSTKRNASIIITAKISATARMAVCVSAPESLKRHCHEIVELVHQPLCKAIQQGRNGEVVPPVLARDSPQNRNGMRCAETVAQVNHEMKFASEMFKIIRNRTFALRCSITLTVCISYKSTLDCFRTTMLADVLQLSLSDIVKLWFSSGMHPLKFAKLNF